jgi:hypothetical protein
VLVLGVAGYDREVDAVTREWAVVADPRSGRTRRRRLAGGTLCYGPLLAVGDHVVFSAYRRRQAVARALPLSLSGPTRSLGRADTFAPSAVPGRLWLGRWSNRPQLLTLREVDAAGPATARAQALLPRFSHLHAATADGFLATGGRWPLRPPPGLRLTSPVAAFSLDERWLAAGVSVRGCKGVAVVDVRAGRWTLVPDSRLGGYEAMAWSPSGRWLYFTAGDRRLSGWRLGAQHAVPLSIHPGGTVMSIATAGPSG